MGKKALFDEDQDAQQEAGQLKVNQEFAKRFEVPIPALHLFLFQLFHFMQLAR